MGEAKLRGSPEERKELAIINGRLKMPTKSTSYFNMYGSGHRNSGYYSRKPHRLNRPWKRREAGK